MKRVIEISVTDRASEADDLVFEHITDPVESVQDYVPGGLHSVYLGDVLCDGRYKVLRKLGYRGYSTVWLAQDTICSVVALKIARADGNHTREIQIHDALRAKADHHPGSAFFVLLKDHLTIQGPNGSHDCLVYDALGPSIGYVLDSPVNFNKVIYPTLPTIRKVAYQVLLGLDFMHSVRVVHGDLYASNVLFILKDLSQVSLKTLCQSEDDVSIGVRRISGPQQQGDPRHLTLDRTLNQFLAPDVEIKISGLGNSFFENDLPGKLETPAEIRSPEVLLDAYTSAAQDCWAFGCLLYYMSTKRYPFDLGFISNEDSRKDTHLLLLFAFLGRLPPHLTDKRPRYQLYFDDQGQLQKFEADDDFDFDKTFSFGKLEEMAPEDGYQPCTEFNRFEEGGPDQMANAHSSTGSTTYARAPQGLFDPDLYPSIVQTREREDLLPSQESPQSLAEFHAQHPPLRQKWLAEKHPDMSLEESEQVLSLLQHLFVCDPAQRLSTTDALRHVWIREYCAPI